MFHLREVTPRGCKGAASTAMATVPAWRRCCGGSEDTHSQLLNSKAAFRLSYASSAVDGLHAMQCSSRRTARVRRTRGASRPSGASRGGNIPASTELSPAWLRLSLSASMRSSWATSACCNQPRSRGWRRQSLSAASAASTLWRAWIASERGPQRTAAKKPSAEGTAHKTQRKEQRNSSQQPARCGLLLPHPQPWRG